MENKQDFINFCKKLNEIIKQSNACFGTRCLCCNHSTANLNQISLLIKENIPNSTYEGLASSTDMSLIYKEAERFYPGLDEDDLHILIHARIFY